MHTAFKEFSFCVYAGVKPKHGMKTQSAKTHSNWIHCVPGHLLKLIQGFDSEKSSICVLNVYPLVDKRHIAQSCTVMTRRISQSDYLKKDGFKTKSHLMLNKWININWQRCGGAVGLEYK